MTDVAVADPELHTGDEAVLRQATFNPKVRTYWLLSGALTLTVSIVGIPLLVLCFRSVTHSPASTWGAFAAC